MSLSDNDISDLSPLKNMHKLTGFAAEHNQIASAFDLRHRAALQRLSHSIAVISTLPQQPRYMFDDIPGGEKRSRDFDAEVLH